jgi:hypothetical protein
MTTTASAPTPMPSQDLPGSDEVEAQAPPRARRVSRGLLTVAVSGVLALTGGALWLTAATGGHETAHRVQVVEDGRSGGPDVYEHGRQADGSFGTSGSRFGSADSLEHQNSSQRTDTQFGSPNSVEHQNSSQRTDTQFGSPNSVEHQNSSQTTDTQFGSADSLEHHATPRAQ